MPTWRPACEPGGIVSKQPKDKRRPLDTFDLSSVDDRIELINLYRFELMILLDQKAGEGSKPILERVVEFVQKEFPDASTATLFIGLQIAADYTLSESMVDCSVLRDKLRTTVIQ